jgi:TPR repeat protein
MLKLLGGAPLCWLVLGLMLDIGFARGQDGAGYDPAAAHYRAPELSLAGGKDAVEVDAAIGLLFSGNTGAAISELEKLATQGGVKAVLFLGGIYREKSRLPIEADPPKALHFYGLASKQGSGEASERISEMLEHHEVPTPGGQGAASWRALAVRQGWVQQQLVVFCMDWIHGPEPLHCDIPGLLVDTDPLVSNGCPSAADMTRLRNKGLTGTLHQDAAHSQRSDGPSAKAILIMDRPVAGEQDLKQPYAASVIYLQTTKEHWQMLPSTAPLLDRYIVLKSDEGGPGIASMIAQNADGSGAGGACGPSAKHSRQ